MTHCVGTVDPAGTRAANNLIAEDLCRSAVHLQTVRSTNSYALQELASNTLTSDMLPRLYLADEQTSGRGRRGRRWLSTSGTLTVSLAIEQPTASGETTQLLSLACGVGIARAIEYTFAPLATRLKWPNDVYLQGGKLAGVLCEANHATPQHVVVGIGMNVAEIPEGIAQEAPAPVSSLAQTAGRPVTRYQCLDEIVRQLLIAIEESQQNPRDLVTAYRSRCLLTGQPVKCQIAGQPTVGTCTGITDKGELALQTESGLVQCRSGEATLIRRAI